MSKKKRVAGSPEAQLEDLRTRLRRIMNEAGAYRADMTYQVELTASTILCFRNIREEILVKNAKPIIKEKSREGDMREKENPIYTLYGKFADLLRRDLRALNMNKELTKAKEELKGDGFSPLDEIMRDLNEEDNE
jgi:hypothetical protein